MYGKSWISFTLSVALAASLNGQDLCTRGDANADGIVSVADSAFLGKYLFAMGPNLHACFPPIRMRTVMWTWRTKS